MTIPKTPKPKASAKQGCISLILTIALLVTGWQLARKFLFQHSIPDYYYAGQFNINPYSVQVNTLKVGFKNDKPYIWIFTYNKKFNRGYDYRIDIIDPIEKKLIKSIPCEQTTSITAGSQMSDFNWYNDFFFAGNELLGLESRNVDNGDIKENNETLSKKFPQLASGIGKVEKSSNCNQCVQITTKDGLQFLYFFERNILMAENEYKQKEEALSKFNAPIDTTSKDFELKHFWGLTRKEQNIRQQLYLTKQHIYILARNLSASEISRLEEMSKSVANIDSDEKRNESIRNEKLVVLVPNKVFLEANIIASNAQYCVVLHNQSIEKDAKKVITCVNNQGRILWELVSPNFESFEKLDGQYPQLSGKIGKNQVILINNTYQNRAVCGLDIQTGKLIWEFIAY
ncbi:hypothetical protein AD998_02575 [bacterium 336/3]|nr:hypothetical protein AD998_02575 [bacterium 336/3]